MKKLILLLTIVLLFGCADKKIINGIEYNTYGFLNERENKNDSIYYKISNEAVIWGVVGIECLFIPPIYNFGFSLYEPICLKKDYQPGITE